MLVSHRHSAHAFVGPELEGNAESQSTRGGPAPEGSLFITGTSPATAARGGPLYDGSPTGMAASTLALTPLTVQQNVPSIGEAQHAPKTKVVAPLEQGEGRAPGWQWGWMRKNIPFAPVTQEHKQRPYGPLRVEPPRMSGHPVGSGREQSPLFKEHKKRPTVLAGPNTVYYTAAAPPTPTWGEPL